MVAQRRKGPTGGGAQRVARLQQGSGEGASVVWELDGERQGTASCTATTKVRGERRVFHGSVIPPSSLER